LHARIDYFNFGVGKLTYAPILLVLVSCVWRLAAGTGERFGMAAGSVVLSVPFVMHVLGMLVLSHFFGYLSSPTSSASD
jgi:hypothetical protein